MLRLPKRPKPSPEDGEDAFLVGEGPAECSSSTELSVFPVNIHDVNGYYRELGVHPRASRRDLRLAYQAAGGPDDSRLTYVFQQLLHPATRSEYDRTPLGQPFWDRYVEAQVKRRMEAEVARRMAWMAAHQMQISDDTRESLSRDIYHDMGYEADYCDTPPETVAEPENVGKDDPRPANLPEQFGYAFYLWRTRVSDDKKLAQWQELLVSALSREGVRTRFSVGLHGRMAHPWLQAQVGYRKVFFLHHLETPTADLARDVAARVKQDQTSTLAEMR